MPSTNNTNNRGGLGGRLARHFALSGVAAVGIAAASASAQIVYKTPNWVIPANIDGLYINVETEVTGSSGSSVPGWDLNPYGTSTSGITFLWATTGPSAGVRLNTSSGGNGSSLSRLPDGFVVGPALVGGASGASFGTGNAAFVNTTPGFWSYNSSNRFGFRFTSASGGTHYGWATMQVGADATTRTITEIAYESYPSVSIVVGSTTGGGLPPYDPCSTANPTITNSNGSNTPAWFNFPNIPTLTSAQSGCSSVGDVFKAQYYRFTASASGLHTFTTCGTSTVARRLLVLSNCNDPTSVIACGSAVTTTPCSTTAPGWSATASLTEGQTAYIVVGATTSTNNLGTSVSVTASSPYNPCGAGNPVITNASGSNSLAWAFATNVPDLTVAQSGCSAAGTVFKAQYYKFTPTLSGIHSFTTCGTTTTGRRLLVLSNCSDPTSVIACGESTTASPCSSTSPGWSAVASLTAGQAVYIVVGGTSSIANLAPTVSVTAAPPYVACTAAELPANSFVQTNVRYQPTYSGSTAPNLDLGSCGVIFKANVYKFTPSVTGTHVFRTCNETADAARRLAVVGNCTGSTVLGCGLSAADVDCPNGGEEVVVALTAGQPVYLVIGGATSSTILASPLTVTDILAPELCAANALRTAAYGANPINSATSTRAAFAVFTTSSQIATDAIWNADVFKFTPTATGPFTFKSCLSGDTKIAISTACLFSSDDVVSTIAYNDDAPTCLTGPGGSPWGSWISANCNNAAACFGLAQELVAGTTYYVVVGGYGSTSAINGNLVIEGPEAPPPPACPADLDLPPDGNVSGSDLAALLAAWGTNTPRCDLDNPPDGNVSGTDLAALLAAWGPCAP